MFFTSFFLTFLPFILRLQASRDDKRNEEEGAVQSREFSTE